MVGNDDLCAGTLHAHKRLQDNALLINPAVCSGGFYHRIFAADIVDGNRAIRRLVDLSHDIQIGERRLHHDDVRPLLYVESSFFQCLAYICGIHLILAAIAECGHTVRRVTERTVVARGILYRITHDARIDKPLRVEPRTNGGNAAVHHIGRSNDVRARTRLTDCSLNEVRQCCVVVHIVIVQLTAVSVTRILAKADITDHKQLRNSLLNRRDCTLHRARHIPRARTDLVLVSRQPKDLDRRNPARGNLTCKICDLIHGVVIAAGHTRNLFLDMFSRHDEDRIYKITRRELCLAYEIAHP